jgi:hypothetical protein
MEAWSRLLFEAKAWDGRGASERERKECVALIEEREGEAFLVTCCAGGFTKDDTVLQI